MTFRKHLNELLKDEDFKTAYEEERRLLELGFAVAQAREQRGITQKELAQQCRVTQQQLSKIENGINCNLLTFIKVSSALGLELTVTA